MPEREPLKPNKAKLIGTIFSNMVLGLIEKKKIVTDRLDTYNPERFELNRMKYPTSVGASISTTEQLFDSYIKNRLDSVEKLTSIKAPNGTPLSEQLKDKKVEQLINNALMVPPEIQIKQEQFKNDIRGLNNLLEKPSKEYHYSHVENFLNDEVKKNAVSAITDQHSIALKKLNDQFKNETFRKQLYNSMKSTPLADEENLPDLTREESAQIDKFQGDIVNQLQTTHDKELENFNKSFEENSKKFAETARTNQAKIDLCWHIYNHGDDKSSKEIADLAREKNEFSSLSNIQNESVLNFNQINLPKSFSVFNQDFAVNYENKTITMKYPILLLRPLDSIQPRDNLKVHMLTLAHSLRALGHNSAKFSIEGKEKDALQAGRKAYEACLEAGFDDSKTTIIVNGKQMKAEELFKDNPNALIEAQRKALTNKENRNSFEQNSKKATVDMKALLHAQKTNKPQSPPQEDKRDDALHQKTFNI